MSTYKMTFLRNLGFARWTLVWLILLTLLFLINPLDNGIILLVVFVLFTMPGIFLHFRYYFKDKSKSIHLAPSYMEINLPDESRHFKYSEISKIEHHHNWWPGKNPWGNYGFIKIILSDTTIYDYTCLVHDSYESAIFFKSKNVQVNDCEEIIPW